MEWGYCTSLYTLESNVTVKTLDSNSNLIFTKKPNKPKLICKRQTTYFYMWTQKVWYHHVTQVI